jgi:hypothetical protein
MAVGAKNAVRRRQRCDSVAAESRIHRAGGSTDRVDFFIGPGQGTSTASGDGLNPAGAIVGYYLDASNVWHGFLAEGE